MGKRSSGGRGARGARSTRQSTGAISTSGDAMLAASPVAVESPEKRGRGRPRRSVDNAPPPALVETPPQRSLSPAAEITVDGRRVSRRQKMPNKRLMPITNGRLADPPPEPVVITTPSPSRGGRRSRGAPTSSSRGRGRRKAVVAEESQTEPADPLLPSAEANGEPEMHEHVLQCGTEASESDVDVSGGEARKSSDMPEVVSDEATKQVGNADAVAMDSEEPQADNNMESSAAQCENDGAAHAASDAANGREVEMPEVPEHSASNDSLVSDTVIEENYSQDKDEYFDKEPIVPRDGDGDLPASGNQDASDSCESSEDSQTSRFADHEVVVSNLSDAYVPSSQADPQLVPYLTSSDSASQASDGTPLSVDREALLCDAPVKEIVFPTEEQPVGGDPLRVVTPTQPPLDQRTSSPLAVGGSALGEAMGPPSPVRFKDPLENSVEDPMDLDSTMEGELNSTVEPDTQSIASSHSDGPHNATHEVEVGSDDLNNDRGALLDESDNVAEPDVEPATLEATDRAEGSPSLGAVDTLIAAVDPHDSCSLPAATMESSRSPLAMDGTSAGGNALDSRSPPADAALEGGPLSPAPPPDPDDNACSFPSIPSKASDSEDSVHAPIPALPAAKTADNEAKRGGGGDTDDIVAKTAALAVSPTMAPPPAAVEPASTHHVEDDRVSSASPAPGYSEDELDDPTGELAALWPPPPTCSVRVPVVANEDSRSSVASEANAEDECLLAASAASPRDGGESPTSLGTRFEKLEVRESCAEKSPLEGLAGPSGFVNKGLSAPSTSVMADMEMPSVSDSVDMLSDLANIPLPGESELPPTPSDLEKTPMPSAESSLSADAAFQLPGGFELSSGSRDLPSKGAPVAVPGTSTDFRMMETDRNTEIDDGGYQSPVDMDISRSPSPSEDPVPALHTHTASTPVETAPSPVSAGAASMAPPAVPKARKPSQEGSVHSDDRASPFMGLFHYDEDSRSPLVTYAAADEPSPAREGAITPDVKPAQKESEPSQSPKPEPQAVDDIDSGLAGRVVNSYVGIRKPKTPPEPAPGTISAALQGIPPSSRVLLKTAAGVCFLTKAEIEAMARSNSGGRTVIIRQGQLPSGTTELTAKIVAGASGKSSNKPSTSAAKSADTSKKPPDIPKFKFSSVPSPTPEEMEACKLRDGLAADADDKSSLSTDSCYDEADAVVQSVVDAAHREAVAAQEQKAAARLQTGGGTADGSTSSATPRPRKPKSIVMERYAASTAGSPSSKSRGGGDSGDSSSTDASMDPLNIPLPPTPTTPPTPGKRRGRPPKSTAQPESEHKDEDSPSFGKSKAKDSRVDAIQNKDINKLRKFRVIQDVIWLKKPKTTKQQKEARRMVCDCCLSPEEMERGDMGCGEDCLNRLLMIECGPHCPLGDRCSNKRFAKRERYSTEVFKTELKGYGLRATADMPANAFIYEYVGEVLDGDEFRRRTAEYDRLKYHHYYFMALKADAVIDATEKGNDSRFINHSCDPNAETQKWTVNGELRIGFFTKRPISAGEEVTFDYQLQRYGREAQKCFCGSEICRGWIGEKTDDQDFSDEESESEPEPVETEPVAPSATSAVPVDAAVVGAPVEPGVQEAPQPVGAEEAHPPQPVRPIRRARQRKDTEKRVLESEISKLVASGLKSKQHTLELSRLMVRAESDADRLTLLELIRTADQPCRRLFLDYHGLKLMWSWMASTPIPQGPGDQDWKRFRIQILETLAVLPIPNKTTLKDSKVLSVVERWASVIPGTPDTDTPSDQTPSDAGDDPAAKEVTELAARLLESWAGLKEVFRIPKKERVELMRAHEKEADRGYQTYLQQHRPTVATTKKGYDCSPERRKRARDSPDNDPRLRKYRSFPDSRMTKEERRQLFMLEVQREEAERQQRQQQQELWRSHEKRCGMLGLDPYLTPIFDPSYQYYWEPSMGSWQPYTPGDPSVPLVPAPGVDPLTVAALPQQLAVYQTLAAADPAQAERYLEQLAQQRAAPRLLPPPPPPDAATGADPAQRPGLLELLQAQLPGHFVDESGCRLHLPPAGAAAAFSGYRLATYCDPCMPNICVAEVPLPEVVSAPQPPPPPPLPTVTLPPGWRVNKDQNGRIYYYNKVSRRTQWGPPPVLDWTSPRTTVTESIWTGEGSSVESSPADDEGSSSSSDSESSSSSDDEAEKKLDEDDDSGVSELPEDMAKEEEIDRRRMVKHRHRGKRRDRLVQERVISPVPELSRHELRKERHRQKRVAKAEARRERRTERAAVATTAAFGEKKTRRVRIPGLSPPPPQPEDGDDTPEPAADTEDAEPAGTGEGNDQSESPAAKGDEEALNPEEEIRRREEDIKKNKAQEDVLRKYEARKETAREKRKIAAKIAARALLKAEAKASAKAEAKAAARAEVRAAKVELLAAKAEAREEAAAKKRKKDELSAAADAAKLSAKKRKVELKRPTSAASTASTSSEPTAGAAALLKEKPTTAAADTSSEVARKIKDKFLAQMSGVVVAALNYFRKSSCKQGRIASTEDFKYLAKKLTHHVMIKELKNVQQVEELSANDSVKHKAKYYVRKYMSRFGPVYSRDAGVDDTEGEAAH